jgi:hypothetical protein
MFAKMTVKQIDRYIEGHRERERERIDTKKKLIYKKTFKLNLLKLAKHSNRQTNNQIDRQRKYTNKKSKNRAFNNKL